MKIESAVLESANQCCIIDTGALVNFCHLELGGKRVIEWLIHDFTIFMTKVIRDEAKTYIAQNDDEAVKMFYGQLIERTYFVEKAWIDIVDAQIKRLPSKRRSRIDSGEKDGAACALEISRIHKHYVVFVTNDFRAFPILRRILYQTQTGIIRNSFDLLGFVVSRHRDKLTINDLELAFRDLNSMIRDKEKEQPDRLLLRYLDSIHIKRGFREVFAGV